MKKLSHLSTNLAPSYDYPEGVERELGRVSKKVTYVIPIERKRLTTKWIGIPFYKALFMGFLDRLGMTKQGLSTDLAPSYDYPEGVERELAA